MPLKVVASYRDYSRTMEAIAYINVCSDVKRIANMDSLKV